MVRMQLQQCDRLQVTNNELQVLNKRKPVHFIPDPPNIPDHAEVYVMKGTNEIFTDYEKYLKRFDWLNQKKFTDAVNGKSGLTYWDALESENKSSKVIDTVFPEALRDPILRTVQFATISRMDELVNAVYDQFKHDYFPGEEVIALLNEGEQYVGKIREKAKFPMIRGADGVVQRPPFSRYFIEFDGTTDEALLDGRHIRRDRKVFTKQNLRAFLKASLQREAWTGAPWLVKEQLAIQYRLPMEIPAHLLQEARTLFLKHQMAMTRPPKVKKPKNMTPEEFARLQPEDLRILQQQQQQQQQQRQSGGGAQHVQNAQNVPSRPAEPRPPPPAPIKYPIEDLDLSPKRNGATRPQLKFFTDEMTDYITKDRRLSFSDIEMNSMGLLLEVWNTLNVQCEVYVLDSFTFDDFVDAMCYQSDEVQCELFEEVHCAVLKMFVDSKGKVLVKDLPKKILETPVDESEVMDESEVSTPQAELPPPGHSTRSRLSHVELAADIVDSPGPAGKQNRAAEMLAERDWIDRLTPRDFENGGWQIIVVGILHQLSAAPLFKSRCDQVLAHLAPEDMEPTQETARLQYASMDVNLRISALQMLTILTIRTEAIKEFLEQCAEDMTDVRKKKLEYQRIKRVLHEERAAKDRERKILQPDNMPESPKHEPVEEPEVTEGSIDLNGAGSSDADDDAPNSGRSLRRGQDRKRKREEDAAKREKERVEKAEAAKAQNKQTKEFQKILKDLENISKQIKEADDKISDCDADLREANIQRTRCLGKDRFCNRYYWFERNGQPFGGLPSSSTAGYGYANGRIWVQGPDEMEREGFIDRTKAEQVEYQRVHQITVPERRKLEEGNTILLNANEWGFYDDPDRLDGLMAWLDTRGDREKKLRKELDDWKGKIVEYMDKYKQFRDEEAAKRIDIEEESSTRVNTRHKVHEEQTAAQERCLKWTNTMALDQIGHLHSKVPRQKKGKQAKEGKGVAVPTNRNGKPVTRQGEKHSFK